MRQRDWLVTICTCALLGCDLIPVLDEQLFAEVFSSGESSSSSSNFGTPVAATGPAVFGGAEAWDGEPLTHADSCEDLLARLQDGAIASIDREAERARNQAAELYPPTVAAGAAVSAPQSATPSAPASMVAPEGGDAFGGQSAGLDATSYSEPRSYSETNVQVPGVDEADIVKSDGEHLFLVRDNRLLVLKAWPAAATAISSTTEIEGSPFELLVRDGVAVVVSAVYDGIPELLAADDPMVALRPYRYNSFSKLTVIDVKGAEPRVLRELFFEGDVRAARRHDTIVRTIIQNYGTPSFYAPVEYVDPWGRPYSPEQIDEQVDAWQIRTLEAVLNTSIADWLPARFERKDGAISDLPSPCSNVYLTASGLGNNGLTSIVTLDLASLNRPVGGAAIAGYADLSYENDSVLVLARSDWQFDGRFASQGQRTALHLFELDGEATTYAASGSVPGFLSSQFSIDELAGVLRISTSLSLSGPFFPVIAVNPDSPQVQTEVEAVRLSTDNRVLTLKADAGKLVTLGRSAPLGKDGETIQSTRFAGDRAYVVTYQQIDPLIVLDLSNPEQPAVLGQLEIPGFSQYIHPLDAGHLLTIGPDGDASGRLSGIVLQIFDVSDVANPRLTHRYPFAPSAYTEAAYNHLAFTFFRPEASSGYEGLLTFPLVNYDGEFRSGLQVFDVSASSGFKHLGEVDHTQLAKDACKPGVDPQPGVPFDYWYYCGYPPEVQRGLFISGEEGTFVYSVSAVGVLVHDLKDLGTAVATLALPSPTSYVSFGVAMTPPPAQIPAPPAPAEPPPPEPAP